MQLWRFHGGRESRFGCDAVVSRNMKTECRRKKSGPSAWKFELGTSSIVVIQSDGEPCFRFEWSGG